MDKSQNEKSSQQMVEKTELTVVWENHVAPDSHKQKVIPFPMRKEATYQERTIQKGESVVQIRIVSSGFGLTGGSMSSDTIKAAA